MAKLWLGSGKSEEPEKPKKNTCSACGGAGRRDVEVYHNNSRTMDVEYTTCPDCNGSGEQ